MNLNNLLHGSAEQAADELNEMTSEPSITQIQAALVNALWRIDLMEKRLAAAEKGLRE